MSRILIGGCLALATLMCGSPRASAKRAVILVRHAEKEANSDDPSLSPAGKKRAEELARVLKDAGVDAINTTEYQRTQQTAAPLAAMLGISAKTQSAAEKPADLVKRLAANHRDQAVLVVGHSNTLPDIIDAYIGKRMGIKIADDDFSQMMILLPKKGGGWGVVRSKY